MKIKYLFALFTVMLFGFKCNRRPKNTDEVVAAFFYYVKNGEYDKIESLRSQVFSKDPEGDRHYLSLLHDQLIQHGIPAKDSWEIKYDTTHEILKLKKYVIVIYKEFNQKEKRDNGFVMDFTFDYERSHTGDSIMFFNYHHLWADHN